MSRHDRSPSRGARGGVLALLAVALLLTLTALWISDDTDGDVGGALPHDASADAPAPTLPDAAPPTADLAQPSALVEPALAPDDVAFAWPDGVRAITLSGRVVDEFDAPWPDAEVVFAPDSRTRGLLPELATDAPTDETTRYPRTRSDAHGRFELRGPRLDERSVAVGALLHDPVIVVTGEGMAWHGFPAPGFRGDDMDLGDLVLRHPGASVSLRAVDEHGAPIAGARVDASARMFQADADDDPHPPNAFMGYALGPTDADGRLHVEHLWPSTIHGSLTDDAHESLAVEIVLVGGEHTDLGELVLTRGRTQTGRVVDAAGQPVPDAQVVLVSGGLLDLLERERVEPYDAPATLFDRFATSAPHARSDAEGRFEIVGVSRTVDDALLLAAAPGHRHGMLRTPFVEGAEVTLALTRSGVLRVDVVSAVDGAPLPDAELRALQHTGFPEVRPPGSGYNTLLTPYAELEVREGRVADIGPLEVTLVAAAPGYLPQRVTTPGLAPGEQRALELRLRPGVSLHGRALDERGEPVPHARVELKAAKPFRALWGTQTQDTDTDGRFAFPALLPGTWSGRASATGHADAEIAAFDSGEEQPELTLSMPRGARVHGVVRRADGEPAAARWLQAANSDVEVELSARTDRYGRYEFAGLPPGAWEIGSAPSLPTWLELAAGDELALDLTLNPTPRLTGVVRSGAEPLVGVRVEAEELDPIGEAASTSTRSRSDGAYALELPTAGEYVVWFHARSGIRVRRELIVRHGADTRLDVDFGTGALGGRVTRVEGSDPLPKHATVRLRTVPDDGEDDDEDEQFVDAMPLDEQGRFHFAPLPAGRYALSVTSALLQPFELGPLELAAGERREGLELRVEGAAQVLLSVTTDDGADFSGNVHVRRSGDDDAIVRRVNSRARGFTLLSLAPGTWRFELAPLESALPDEPGAEFPFLGGETLTLTAGEERRLELTARTSALR